MLDRDDQPSEYEVPAGRRSMSSESSAPQRLNEQVHDTIEALKLKLENLRFFLSWHGNR